MTTTEAGTHLPSPEDVGGAVRMIRGLLGWSQESLAELSGLTTRTVQRTESGQPYSIDTRRAIARAIGCDDLDFFSRPIANPMTPDEAAATKAAFGRENITLPVDVVDGRGVIYRLLEANGFSAVGTASAPDLPRAAQDAYAAILDFLRDCLDVMDVASRVEMLGYGDTIEELAAPLREAGFCLCAAVREVTLAVTGGDGKLLPTTVVYVFSAPESHPPAHVVVKRNVNGPV
jgi:transcriptional regulator with XRE-family HTH domain